MTTTPLNGVDYHYVGDAQPKLLLGWGNTFTYKKFDLNVFFGGVFGNKIFNATRADLFRPSTAMTTNILVDAQDESPNDLNSYKYSSRFIEDGSYIRLDNMTLGYNFGNSKLDISYTNENRERTEALLTSGLNDTARIKNKNNNVTLTYVVNF